MLAARRHAAVAALAAVVATAADLLLLAVANAPRPELGLPALGRGWLWPGGALGVAAIPLYALGYRAAAGRLPAAAPRAARAVARLGALAAVVGAAIHGLTARLVHAGLARGEPVGEPLAAVAASPLLVVLWGVAAAAALGASACFAWGLTRGGAAGTTGPEADAAPRALALANPAGVTLALALLGLATPFGRAFLAPAAPNLAHLVFFAACAAAAGPPRGRRAR